MSAKTGPVETDPRFPSGPWTGYFLQPGIPGRHRMELRLTFHGGTLEGEGRDWVGRFLIRGRYSTGDGRCHWTKRYLGKHDVFYKGFNEGKGIWGTWAIPGAPVPFGRGGFHIWPEGLLEPEGDHLAEAADVPIEAEEQVTRRETVGVPT